MAELSSPYHDGGRTTRPPHNERVVRNAVAQVVESGQQLLSNRLDLAQLELKLAMKEGAERGAAFAAGGSLLAAGFVVFTYGLVQLLNHWLPSSASALIVGGTYLAAGGVSVWQASKKHGKERTLSGPILK